MKKNLETLNVDTFFSMLQQDKLDAPFSLSGMVKKPEGKEKSLPFAIGTHCRDWVNIPLHLIEAVEVIGKVPCKDHAHTLVKLYFKDPGHAEAKVFFSLLKVLSENSKISQSSSDIMRQRCEAQGCRVREHCQVDKDGRIIRDTCHTVCYCDSDSPMASFRID